MNTAITALAAFNTLQALCAGVTRWEVLASLRLALSGVVRDTRGSFAAVSTVGVVVAASVPDSYGASQTVYGVVVATRMDPTTGRTAAVVVDRMGRLHATRVTERPGLGGTTRVTAEDFRSTLDVMVAEDTDPRRAEGLAWLPRPIPALDADVLRGPGGEHRRALVARYEGALAEALAAAVAAPTEENIEAVWWAEDRREAAYGRFLVG